MSKKCRKKSVCAVVVMVAMLCISGCGSGKIKSDKVLRVGVVTYTQDDPFINALADKLKENLKSMETEDMKITVSVKNGNDDQQDQNDIVEEMIDAGCDVLCVNLETELLRPGSSGWQNRMTSRLFSLTGNRSGRI